MEIERQLHEQMWTSAAWWQAEGSEQGLIARDSFDRAMANGLRSNDTKFVFPFSIV